MRHCRQAPHHDGERESGPHAETIHQPSGAEQPDGVCELKREHDVRVVDLTPAELRLQRRLEQADHLAIDVVDRRGEEEHRADNPSAVADTGSL
jgi:hypothetical protein